MILVFDLDDTLYPEIRFVRSGFRAVAALLEGECGIPPERSVRSMRSHIERSRSGVLDGLLLELGLHSQTLLRRCVSAYRLHRPQIDLDPAGLACLRRFGHWPRYVVTDGHRLVQRNKIRALGIDRLVDRCFVTHEHGLRFAKPSPHCFELIRRRHDSEPSSVVYVGDDPNKDFVGIKPLGFGTIRLRQGRFRSLRLDPHFEAHIEIGNLGQLTEEVIARASAAARRGGLTPGRISPRLEARAVREAPRPCTASS